MAAKKRAPPNCRKKKDLLVMAEGKAKEKKRGRNAENACQERGGGGFPERAKE